MVAGIRWLLALLVAGVSCLAGDPYVVPPPREAVSLGPEFGEGLTYSGKMGCSLGDTTEFDGQKLRGGSGYVAAYFSLPNGQSLRDSDGKYTTTSGNVSTWVTYAPPYDSTTYSDAELFIPVSQLHVRSGTGCEVTIDVRVEAQVDGKLIALASSKDQSFVVK